MAALMTHDARNESLEVTLAVLRDAGLDAVVEHGRKHIKVKCAGQTIIVAATASDLRAPLNARAFAKKFVAKILAPAVPTKDEIADLTGHKSKEQRMRQFPNPCKILDFSNTSFVRGKRGSISLPKPPARKPKAKSCGPMTPSEFERICDSGFAKFDHAARDVSMCIDETIRVKKCYAFIRVTILASFDPFRAIHDSQQLKHISRIYDLAQNKELNLTYFRLAWRFHHRCAEFMHDLGDDDFFEKLKAAVEEEEKAFDQCHRRQWEEFFPLLKKIWGEPLAEDASS